MLDAKVIDAKYRIIQRMSYGTVAPVYLAHHLQTGREVALKVIPRARNTNMTPPAFQQLVAVLQSVPDRYVVPVLESTSDQSFFYLIIEPLEVETLERRILAQGFFRADQALSIAREAVLALGDLASQNLLHGALNSRNLLLTYDNTVALVDFGLVQWLGQPTGAEVDPLFDAARYRSPEIASGAAPQLTDDFYALGICIREMLTGLRAGLQAGPAPGAVPGAIQVRLFTFLDQLTAERRADRPQSPAEIVAAIESLRAGSRAPAPAPRPAVVYTPPPAVYQPPVQPAPVYQPPVQPAPLYQPPAVAPAPYQPPAPQPAPVYQPAIPQPAPVYQPPVPQPAPPARPSTPMPVPLEEPTTTFATGQGHLQLVDLNKWILLEHEKTLVGRSDPAHGYTADIDLSEDPNGRSVSRRHVEITKHADVYTIEDLNSRNFTLRNGERVMPGEPQPLYNGDELLIGQVRCKFLLM